MKRRNGPMITLVLCLLAFIWMISVVWHNFIDDGRTPPDSAFPAVPTDAVVKSVQLQCASGGCWREMSLEVDSMHAHQLINEMDLAEERCGFRNVLTLSRICIGADYFAQSEEVRVYMQYDF